MKDKNKVTLYIPPELHRQLKIQSAVDSEPMSAIAERALVLYLEHSEECSPSHGHAYQVHSCPKCSADFILQNGEAVAIAGRGGADSSVDMLSSQVIDDLDSAAKGKDYLTQEHDPEELVPC